MTVKMDWRPDAVVSGLMKTAPDDAKRVIMSATFRNYVISNVPLLQLIIAITT